jgi:hypothetical protein
MDYLRFAIALAPMGIYWILIGYLYQRRNPMLINAAQDTLLLGLGVIGFVAIGPVELFFPTAAYSVLGDWTWFFLLCLYGFVVLFLALNRRPQWTLYGASSMALRGILERVLQEQQIEHSWQGMILVVPEIGLRGIVEPANVTDGSAHLTACGRDQDIAGWNRLERWVVQKLSSELSSRGGWVWIVAGMATIALSIAMFWMDLDRAMLAWEDLSGIAPKQDTHAKNFFE